MTPDAGEYWESRWSRPGFPTRSSVIPQEIREAVEQRWLPPGSTVLDIGCGSGWIGAWLAQRGYHVTGVDIAPSAIELARQVHGGVPGLQFAVDDISRGHELRGQFEALLDRGCFHAVPEKSEYVENVGAAALPGARFLLLSVIPPSSNASEEVGEQRALFNRLFEVNATALTSMTPMAGQTVPGVALWMTRRR